jgi:hypothetical protein
VTFSEEPEKPWRVAIREDASEEQKARIEGWIGPVGEGA